MTNRAQATEGFDVTRMSEVTANLLESARRRRRRYGAFGVVAIVLGYGVPAVAPGTYSLHLAISSANLAMLAVSIAFLLRELGRVSFGHAAFFGIAGYAFAIVLRRTELGGSTAFILGLATAAAASFLLALVIVRVSGIAFAMLTLAFGQAVWIVSTRWREWTGAWDGLAISYPESFFGIATESLRTPTTQWMLSWSFLGLTVAGLWLLQGSRLGRTMRAIRDNPERAQFCGYGTYWPVVIGFTISGSIAGLAGMLDSVHSGLMSPSNLHWSTSGEGLITAIVGGAQNLIGPVLGAFVFGFFSDVLLEHFDLWRLILGLTLIVIIVFSPSGMTGAIGRLFGRRSSEGAGPQDLDDMTADETDVDGPTFSDAEAETATHPEVR